MAERVIKEGEPMDPVQVGDIITLELKNGSIVSDLLAVQSDDDGCATCYMFHSRKKHGCRCFDGWKIRNQENYGSGPYTDVALCCTKPVFDMENSNKPEFCRFIKLDSILESL